MTTESKAANDEELIVRRAQAGSAQAFGILVERYQQFAYNLALRTLGNSEEACDICQEAFIRAWKALPGFKRQAQFRTWLYRIVVNLCYNRIPRMRADMAANPVEDEVFQEQYTAPGIYRSDLGKAYEKKDLLTRLDTLMKALPPSNQVLLQLRYQEDLGYAEIAEVLSIPVGTVKNRLFRIHQQLYSAIQAEEEVVKCI